MFTACNKKRLSMTALERDKTSNFNLYKDFIKYLKFIYNPKTWKNYLKCYVPCFSFSISSSLSSSFSSFTLSINPSMSPIPSTNKRKIYKYMRYIFLKFDSKDENNWEAEKGKCIMSLEDIQKIRCNYKK